MKRFRPQRYVPPPPPGVAVFTCRGCGASLTAPLRRLDESAALATKELAPLVPAGTYWPVAVGHLPSSFDDRPVDFAGCFAVRPDALAGVDHHPDHRRLNGCCGPNGAHGHNRVCRCGRSVGTERSDCMWPAAVYLEPKAVRPVEKGAAPDGGQ